MSGTIETAHAKLNLALHVRARGADGYHAIETLFVFCEDGDRLELADAPGLTIGGAFAGALAGGGDNLVTRAAERFAATFIPGAVAGFHLEKKLPVAAGIGGGSADAAAALRVLARRHGVDRADPRLLEIAGELGADVPACLASTTAFGRGRGDALVPAPDPALAGMAVLLVNPRVPLATGPVFAGWDPVDRGPLADAAPLAAALSGRNDLEAPARALVPTIGAVLDALLRQAGVVLARMSGSGATCFALFESEGARDAADRAIGAARPDWWRLATRLRA